MVVVVIAVEIAELADFTCIATLSFIDIDRASLFSRAFVVEPCSFGFSTPYCR